MLLVFGLERKDVYGAMSDAGPDVKRMMSKELELQWERCIAYMTNAATKYAFGLEPSKSSHNPEVSELIAQCGA
ncbi:hypothetical protein PybrP1_006159 [[Pythium] brassicae (nom. inval.)]|nr:hypothetical protein PybrP1_006159 [[Pythium] brassicae (nom. inval.)]